MALKAGYYGIKKSVLNKLLSLSDGVIIKTIGSGLNLSSNGTLSVDGSGSGNYSTNEYDTGKKWIDGKKIYGKVMIPADVSIGTSWVNLGASGIGAGVADTVITTKGLMADASYNEVFPVPDGTLDISFNRTSDVVYVKSLSGSWDHGPKYIIIEYTKQAANKKK